MISVKTLSYRCYSARLQRMLTLERETPRYRDRDAAPTAKNLGHEILFPIMGDVPPPGEPNGSAKDFA